MELTDQQRFFDALLQVSAVFSDPMSTTRLTAYWHIISPQMTIAEWEAACQHTMDHGMFYKVPLPAVFLGYVETQRQTIAEAQRLETQRLADRQAYGFNAPAVSVPGKDRAWARLHVAMIEAGIPRPGHYDEAVEYCERCVTLDPDNAADWQAEADWWRQGAHGRPVLPSMHRAVETWDLRTGEIH